MIMRAKLDIIFHVNNPLWKTRLRPYTKTIRQALEIALSETKLKNSKNNFEIAVVLADDEFVKSLNKQYRDKNKPTNVLSFPASSLTTDHQPLTTELGDIILALETIEKEAKEQHKTFRDHSKHLLVHGFLHLLEYDHISEDQAAIMENKEVKILKKLDVNNPYL